MAVAGASHEKGEESGEPELKITIRKPVREREAVGVGASGGDHDDGPEGSVDESSEESHDLPDSPDVLPDVPDAPPPEGDGS